MHAALPRWTIGHSVFVILPLVDNAHVTRVFDRGIVPALESLGYEAKRIDSQALAAPIAEAIRKQIEDAYFVIADLSSARPNCYYELGYAHALRKPALLLKSGSTKIHFNVSNYMIKILHSKQPVARLIRKLVPELLVTPSRGAGDSRNGKFGRYCIENDYRLCARVVECTDEECWLDLEVVSLNPGRPLVGPVKFYLHESYVQSARTIVAKGGRACYELVSSHDGPWTLGAEAGTPTTQLELDLATIPGAKPWWYQEAYPKS